MGIERERGISVVTSVMTFEYGGCVFNLLDTPGHEDFSEDTYRTLTAVDSAVMVIDAAKGIEARTRKLFEVCRLRDIPIVTFINKLDRESRDPFDLLDEIEKTLALDTAPVTWPIGRGRDFRRRLSISADEIGRASWIRTTSRCRSPARTIRARSRCCRREAERVARWRQMSWRARALKPFDLAGLSRRPSDAGAVRQRAAQFRRARSHRRDGRIRAVAARAARPATRTVEARRAEDDRLRLQDPGEHGPEPSRPHRLHARLLGQAHARHEGEAGAHRQADQRSTRRSSSSRRTARSPTRRSPAMSSAFPTTACCASATR